jgi:hypothetical protein
VKLFVENLVELSPLEQAASRSEAVEEARRIPGWGL